MRISSLTSNSRPPREPFINADGSPVAFEMIDETTFKFTFKNPKGLFLQYLATARPLDNAAVRYPKHYLQKFHPKYNPDIEAEIKAAGQTDWLGLMVNKSNFWPTPRCRRSTLGSSRKATVAGSATRAFAERNPYYWKVDTEGNQLPYINTRTFDVLSDPQVLVTKTLAGEIDFQDRNLATTANKPVLFEGQEAGGFEFFEETPVSPNYMVMMLNLNHKDPKTRALFQNKDFRIGLSYAMDRQEVLDASGSARAKSPRPRRCRARSTTTSGWPSSTPSTISRRPTSIWTRCCRRKTGTACARGPTAAVRADLCLQRRDPSSAMRSN